MKNITIILLLTFFQKTLFAQKKGNTEKNQAVKSAPVYNMSSTVLKADEMFSALNVYEARPVVVNNNASLSISYSAFVVGLDHQRIKSEANDILSNKYINSPELLAIANMKYRYHFEFLPMDGSFNVMFIRPDQNINPKNVVSLPTNKVTANLKYKMSN
jgi:hypothetical protein